MTKTYAESTYSNDTLGPFRHDTTRDSMVTNDWNNAPPPYSLIAGDAGTLTENDGRVRVDVNSKLARTLSVFIKDRPEQPLPESQDLELEEFEQSPPLNIVIQIVGSRGDVQPFIALAMSFKNLVIGSG
jgi:hypothetical protein